MKTRTIAPSLVASVCLGLLAATRVTGQIIVNGGFESGSFSPGWSLLSDPQNGVHTLVTSLEDGIVPFAGSFFATFSNSLSQASGITQSLTTTPGQSYVLSYWFTNSADSDTGNEFKVMWDGSTLTDLVGFSSLGTVWTNATFFVTGTGTDTLAFSGFQDLGWNGLDAVSLTAVPESSTCAALFGITALGFAAYRRRFRQPC